MVNGVPGSILTKWEKERQEKAAHAREMVKAYTANRDEKALAYWEKVLERLEKQNYNG